MRRRERVSRGGASTASSRRPGPDPCRGKIGAVTLGECECVPGASDCCSHRPLLSSTSAAYPRASSHPSPLSSQHPDLPSRSLERYGR